MDAARNVSHCLNALEVDILFSDYLREIRRKTSLFLMHVLYQLTCISTDPPPSSVTALEKVRSYLMYFGGFCKIHLYIHTPLSINDPAFLP